MCRYCKCQTHIHAAGVVFDRCIKKLLNFREGHYFIELSSNLWVSHTEDCAVKKNVFSTRQFWMEAGPNFKQTGNAASQAHPSFTGIRDPAQDLQQGRFSCTVPADDADHISPLNLKRHISTPPQILHTLVTFLINRPVG